MTRLRRAALLLAALALSLGASAADPEGPPGPPAADPVLVGELSNSDGTLVSLPLFGANASRVQSILDLLQAKGRLGGAKAILSEASSSPRVVLIGSPAAVLEAKRTIVFVLRRQLENPPFLVDVQVSLRSFTLSEINRIGVNLFPRIRDIGQTVKVVTTSGSDSKQGDTWSRVVTAVTSGTAVFANIDLVNSDNVGKILISGELLTASGAQATISDNTKTPIIISSGDFISTEIQNLRTKIKLTPTISQFVAENPAKSHVSLTVDMQVAVNTGVIVLAGTEAPTYTVKTLKTDRVYPTDGENYVAAIFTSDLTTRERTYIPLLGQLPILSYFFSAEKRQTTTTISLLFVAVRLIPTIDQAPDALAAGPGPGQGPTAPAGSPSPPSAPRRP